MKPTFFISSTIFDFSDLRSAVKWFLEEKGYTVNASEFNDFHKPLDANSYEACLKAIDSSHYFILLIGERIGGMYDAEISITNQEYRHAYELAKRGSLKIISFIRKETWVNHSTLKRSLKSSPTASGSQSSMSMLDQDTRIRLAFIDEVRRVSDLKSGAKPVNNWIHTFDTFKDVINVLEIELRDKSGLAYKQKRYIINEEIRRSLSQICTKDDGLTGLSSSLIDYIFEDVTFDFDKPFLRLSEKQIGHYAWFFISHMRKKEWSCEYLKTYYSEGFFLEYDGSINDYVAGNLHKLAGRLLASYSKVKSLQETVYEKSSEKMLSLSKKANPENYFKVKPLDLFMAFELSDELLHFIALSKELYNALLELPFTVPTVSKKNRLPQEMQGKTEVYLTDSEMDEFLRKRN